MATYILLIIVPWPFCALIVSIFFGQLSFYSKYLKKIGKRMINKKQTATPVAIFASGAGSNAEKIIAYSKCAPANFTVKLIVYNKPEAGVLNVAAKYNIETLLINKEKFFTGDAYVTELQNRGIAFIVLAGFLWKIPPALISAWRNKIINIHPALLPKYGGKGMYGDNVHQAIITAKEKESGITIHYVDELYDHGNIIFQAKCEIDDNDTAQTLAKKIHLLEHEHYPDIIAKTLKMQNSR